jgi:hypothetical protein
MSELYDKIVAQRGRIESLIARIPGFKGYQDKQARRTADRMLRDYVSDELEKRIARFVRLENKIIDGGGLKYMTKSRDAKARLQTYHDKIKTAAPPYDGMWAQMKIGSEELEKIYSFDEAQVRYLDQFDTALDAAEKAVGTDDLGVTLEKIHETATEAIEAFSLRDEVLTGLSKTV